MRAFDSLRRCSRMRRKRRAQSILEYTLILSAIIAGIIFAAKTMVRPAVEQSFTDATDSMNTMTSKFNTQVGGGAVTP